MILKSIRLCDYRNYVDETIDFDPCSNIIYGKNAQGKTNIIEAIWLFTSGKSFRTSNEREFIKKECYGSSVTGFFSGNGRDYETKLNFFLDKSKEIFINDVKVKQKEMFGKFPAVLFYPESLSLIKSGPDTRRKFLDNSICQIKPRYIDILFEYNRILLQKNRLLKSFGKNIDDTIEIWNARQAKLSSIISNTRKTYCEKLTDYALKYLSEISCKTENLTVNYSISGGTSDEYDLFNKICSSYKQEKVTGFTQIGAHKDDFEFFINGISSKKYASQGQQRSIVLCLKLAEADIIAEVGSKYPLLLFDDVLSELDSQRKTFITNCIKDKQVIITSCEMPCESEGKIINIKNGKYINNGE